MTVQARPARRRFAPKAARNAVPARRTPAAMRIDRDDEFEPFHASSPTARVLDELQLYGHRPHQDEPDPRPLPDQRAVQTALADVFEAFISMLSDTRLEPDLEDLLSRRRLSRRSDQLLRTFADRCRRVPRLWHHRQPRRQGAHPWGPRLALRQRRQVSVAPRFHDERSANRAVNRTAEVRRGQGFESPQLHQLPIIFISNLKDLANLQFSMP